MRWIKPALLVASVPIVVLGAAPAAASGGGAQKSSPSDPVVVVSGLNNPRQLSLVGGAELLIAEAGKGGSIGPFDGPEGPFFVGNTGSVSSVFLPQLTSGAHPNRIVTGLLSTAGQDGSAATGSDGVSARHIFGPLYIQETFVPPDVLPPALARQSGKLLRAQPFFAPTGVANISAYEAAHDPDGKGVDTNPYAVLARSHDELVADAAANTVFRVDKHRRIHVFHVFPNVRTGACAGQADPDPAHPGCNFVPTSLARDSRGHIYVGGLSSLTPGEAQVVKLSRDGRHVLHRWKGFSAVTGVAVDRHGSLYVSQLFAPEANPPNPQITGVLTKIHHGTRTNVDVPFPAGVAVDRSGNVFVSAYSIAPETGLGGPDTSGQVWRLRF